jgi:hypothetical protein
MCGIIPQKIINLAKITLDKCVGGVYNTGVKQKYFTE